MALIAYPDGPDAAVTDPAEVASLLHLTNVSVALGWTLQPRPWLASADLRGVALMAGYALAPAINEGRLRYLPVRLSAVPALMASWRPDVTLVRGVRRGDCLAFSGSLGWGPAAVRSSRHVVVEVDPDLPDLGGPLIEGQIAAHEERTRESAETRPPRPASEDELVIGRQVASLLPEDATIQFGPGGMAEGLLASLERPVHIWSGLLTDAAAGLAERGLLLGRATAAYVWGGEPITRLHAAGRLELRPVEETHDLTRVSAIPRFVACNTALQVGLDGSVNVERVGGRTVAGIGGHADYSAAASRSVGGFSVISLQATDRRGNSTIVARPEVVSTPRCDVSVVVTEYGIADLRDGDDAERARRLVAIAAPQHRAGLSA
jgi:acyl-CoA hydrolase